MSFHIISCKKLEGKKMSQPKSRSSKNNFLNKWIGKNNQLGQMFRGSDFNYTAAITTKCPHFLQIVLENNPKLTLKAHSKCP